MFSSTHMLHSKVFQTSRALFKNNLGGKLTSGSRGEVETNSLKIDHAQASLRLREKYLMRRSIGEPRGPRERNLVKQ